MCINAVSNTLKCCLNPSGHADTKHVCLHEATSFVIFPKSHQPILGDL